MIGSMFKFAALFGLLSSVVAIVRQTLDARLNRGNIARLARRHHLDQRTAARLYEVARKDGFGSAWDEVVERAAGANRVEDGAIEPLAPRLAERRRAGSERRRVGAESRRAGAERRRA
jgi:hypothetical protein